MTAEQVDEVLNQAARNIAGSVDVEKAPEIVGSAAQCDEVLARLKAAAAE
jgi:hypothetical protein